MSSNKSQAELSILACKNYLHLKHRDSFLLEIGRLQVWAIVFPELLEREEYKELISVFESLLLDDDFLKAGLRNEYNFFDWINAR